MRVDHHEVLLYMNVIVYDITFKQGTVHICLQRNVCIACLMTLY